MKRFIAVFLLLAITVTPGCAGSWENVSGDYPDKLYQTRENDVELIVFRIGDTYLTFTVGDNVFGWLRLLGDAPAEMVIPDGGFARITADVIRNSGGVDGFMNEPQISRLKSFQTETLSDMTALCGIADYDPDGETVYNCPLVYGEYLLIDLYGEYFVYRGGSFVGKYGTALEAESAMGIRELRDKSAEITDEYDKSVYIFRCGDTYLAYVHSIFFNRWWTPLLDKDFNNDQQFIELADGEAAYIKNAHILKVNGGEAGYVNAPMIVSAEGAEKITYDWLTLSISAEHYAETPPDSESNLREYMVSRFLIIWLDGKYHVYTENDGTPTPLGVYDSISEVDDVLGRNGD